MQIVLASTSSYRKQLLSRIFPDFSVDSPNIDETPLAGENATALAKRLATDKANAVSEKWPNSLVIGSDQVAALQAIVTATENPAKQQEIFLGKPGNYDAASKQLELCSDSLVNFYTGCAVLNTKTGHCQSFVERYSIRFRPLSHSEIDSYLQREQPYDCSASLKSEGLGGSLIQQHIGNDPSTLIGLPLIQLQNALAKEGIHPLSA